MPNAHEYHGSFSYQLDAIKSRIGNLVTDWPTAGEWKEVALRTVLRRHDPESAEASRGFFVGH
jgi:hypothetical protein